MFFTLLIYDNLYSVSFKTLFFKCLLFYNSLYSLSFVKPTYIFEHTASCLGVFYIWICPIVYLQPFFVQECFLKC